MNLKHYTAVEERKENSETGFSGRVAIGESDGAHNFYMRVMTVSKPGTFHSPHAHEWEHEVFIHAGQGEVYGNGEWVPFKAGDVVFIPGGEEHGWRNNGNEPLIYVCCIPAGFGEL